MEDSKTWKGQAWGIWGDDSQANDCKQQVPPQPLRKKQGDSMRCYVRGLEGEREGIKVLTYSNELCTHHRGFPSACVHSTTHQYPRPLIPGQAYMQESAAIGHGHAHEDGCTHRQHAQTRTVVKNPHRCVTFGSAGHCCRSPINHSGAFACSCLMCCTYAYNTPCARKRARNGRIARARTRAGT